MSTFFERRRHAFGKGTTLDWLRVRNGRPRGLVFVPPLIGGDLSQQVHTFRWLIRERYDLLSFSYSGHGDSSGTFSLGATLRDTFHMVGHAHRVSEEEHLPLLGIASCYSAIPLLHALYRLAEPARKLVLINAIPRLGPRAVMRSFVAHYIQDLSAEKGLPGLKAALRLYAESLFPGVKKGRDHFGLLERGRARLLRTFSEFLMLNPLKGVCLSQTPVLCLHARGDSILKIYDLHVAKNYRNDIRRLCPQAAFHPLEADHFLSPPSARGEAVRSIASFLKGS
ncbi:MAG: hypothetical protein SWE60_07760 [Thermodesulfobacteriota bacterium]|nr:hypothetical protein [Thermodesulfobacteriota bacterium]